MIKPIDEKYRIQAVTDVSHNLMVEAGAGTGKTTLLVQRTVQAIVEGGIDVDRVVLITFMEKAAHEIRVRLAQALETIEGDGLGRARKALRHLGQARITTIHGFCMDILQRHAISAGVPVGFAVLDPIEADRLWDEVFDHWIQTSQDLNVVLEDFLAANVGMGQVRDMVRIISQWDDIEQTSYEAPLYAQALDRIAEDVEAWAQTAMAEADPNDAGRRQIEDLRRFLRSRGEDAWNWIRTLQSWPVGAPKGNKKGWQDPGRLAAQKTWLKENLMPDIARRQTQLADFLMGSLIRVTRREFLPLYQQRRFSLGMLSFDDLLLRTRDLLRNQAAVVQAIAQSFDLMMVDEFQDTDPVQTEIIMRLTQDRAGVLFLVGDPKQAIYRFRGADVELYAEVRSQWEQRPDAAVLPIFHNFRSDPQILSAVNQYFAQKFPAQADPLRPYVPVYYPLQTHGSEDGRIRVVVDGGAIAENAEDRRRHEAMLAAEYIAVAIAEGWPVHDNAKATVRPIEYRDMVLIMPSRTGLDIFDSVFASRGIPLAKESGTGFFRRDEVRGYAALLKVLQNPLDAISLIAFLGSPWVGLDFEKIMQHQLKAGTWDYRQAQPETEVGNWQKIIHRWYRNWWKIPPEALLVDVIETTRLTVTLTARRDWAALANLDKLRVFSARWGSAWGIDDYASWLAAKVAEGADEEEGPIIQQDNAVHFTTVHRSKGLEWPLVVVANWTRTSRRHGSVVRTKSGTPAMKVGTLVSAHWEDWVEETASRDAAEEQRLLYVALTRAREYMAVFDVWAKNREPSHDFMQLSPHRLDAIRPPGGLWPPTKEISQIESHPRVDIDPTALGRLHSAAVERWKRSSAEYHFVESLKNRLENPASLTEGTIHREGGPYHQAVRTAARDPFFHEAGLKSAAWHVSVSGERGDTEVDQVRIRDGMVEVVRFADATRLVEEMWPDQPIIEEALSPTHYWVWVIDRGQAIRVF